MNDDFHRQLAAEARADGAVLHDLRQRVGALQGRMSTAHKADVDGVRREFAVLHDEFDGLHGEDMQHKLDRSAHRSWRARMRGLAVRVDQLG